MLQVTIEKLDQTTVLHCAGRIVRGDETALLCAASRSHGHDVVIDLEKVESIDASGVGALVALQAAGIYVQLVNASAPVREVLRVTQVDSIVDVGATTPRSPMPTRAAA